MKIRRLNKLPLIDAPALISVDLHRGPSSEGVASQTASHSCRRLREAEPAALGLGATPLAGEVKLVPSMRNVFSLQRREAQLSAPVNLQSRVKWDSRQPDPRRIRFDITPNSP